MGESVVVAGLCGMVATLVTYPIDMMHGRLSVQRADYHPYRGIFDGIREAQKRSGVRSLYHGLVPSLWGVFPYVGISFATYEALRPILPKLNDGSGRPTPGFAIGCGIVSSLMAQAASYPLDTCRRCMQIQQMVQVAKPLDVSDAWRLATQLEPEYSKVSKPVSMKDTMVSLVKEKGIRRLYRGWTANFWKALPVSVVSYYTYESCRQLFNNSMDEQI